MRTFTLLLALGSLFISAHAGAQCRLTLSEAEKLTSYDEVKYAKEVVKKGFAIQSARSNETYKVYQCRERNKTGKNDEIKRAPDPNNKIMLQITTADKAYFETLKAGVLKQYKYIAEYPMQVNGVNTKQHLYTGKCNVSLYSYTMPDKTTWHTLQISEKW